MLRLADLSGVPDTVHANLLAVWALVEAELDNSTEAQRLIEQAARADPEPVGSRSPGGCFGDRWLSRRDRPQPAATANTWMSGLLGSFTAATCFPAGTVNGAVASR